MARPVPAAVDGRGPGTREIAGRDRVHHHAAEGACARWRVSVAGTVVPARGTSGPARAHCPRVDRERDTPLRDATRQHTRLSRLHRAAVSRFAAPVRDPPDPAGPRSQTRTTARRKPDPAARPIAPWRHLPSTILIYLSRFSPRIPNYRAALFCDSPVLAKYIRVLICAAHAALIPRERPARGRSRARVSRGLACRPVSPSRPTTHTAQPRPCGRFAPCSGLRGSHTDRTRLDAADPVGRPLLILPAVTVAPLTCDLLHGLKAVASGHRMTGLPRQTVGVPTRTQREPAAYRRNSRFLPRCRAVARSRRPHRNRCHCRVTNRPRSPPPLVCWGPASHRFRSSFYYVGPRQKPSVGHPVRPQCGGLSLLSVRSTPACSLLGSDSRRNTRHSREGGGMRSYLYHRTISGVRERGIGHAGQT